jgi:hypothetical protein
LQRQNEQVREKFACNAKMPQGSFSSSDFLFPMHLPDTDSHLIFRLPTNFPMKTKTLKAIAGVITTVGVMAVTAQQAQAGTIVNGWNYSMDSNRDGTEGNTIGANSKFEFYGMAFQETADSFVFAFNSNLAFDPTNAANTGYAAQGAKGDSVTYGDLFLNFTNPQSMNAAEGSLYAVRFDQTNDTKVGLGLYKNVTTASYTTANWGYGTVASHTNTVNNGLGGTAGYGDMAADTSYFAQDQAAQTAIASGERLGDISFLSQDLLGGLGLNFGNSTVNPLGEVGTQTFGFKISKSLFGGHLPKGSFVASLFAECGNDGMVLTGSTSTASTPEPSAMLGFAAVGLMVGSTQMKRRRSVKLEA